MNPTLLATVALAGGTVLTGLWSAAEHALAWQHRRRLDRYDDALLAVANEGRDPR